MIPWSTLLFQDHFQRHFLLLLVLSLFYSPLLPCQALRCNQCFGSIRQGEEYCGPLSHVNCTTACVVMRGENIHGDGTLVYSCYEPAPFPESQFQCSQTSELDQHPYFKEIQLKKTDYCIKASLMDVVPEKCRDKKLNSFVSDSDISKVLQQHLSKDPLSVELCRCTTDLCNNYKLSMYIEPSIKHEDAVLLLLKSEANYLHASQLAVVGTLGTVIFGGFATKLG